MSVMIAADRSKPRIATSTACGRYRVLIRSDFEIKADKANGRVIVKRRTERGGWQLAYEGTWHGGWINWFDGVVPEPVDDTSICDAIKLACEVSR